MKFFAGPDSNSMTKYTCRLILYEHLLVLSLSEYGQDQKQKKYQQKGSDH
jgi:hypothetical protein